MRSVGFGLVRRFARHRARHLVHRLVRRLALGALVCSALGAGCNIPGARVYNLDALHDSTGRHRYRAGLVSDTEYLLREGFGGILHGFGSEVSEKEPSKVEDPTESCLENLNGLLEADPSDADVAATQVELCSRIATSDVWRLSRERATLGLGRAGERLGLARLPPRTPGTTTANAEQLSDLLARFVKAVTPYVAGGDREVARAEIVALAGETRAFEYDAAGLPRVLRGVRLLAASLGRDIPELVELSLDLQARAIRSGLERALEDEDPFVVAAAVSSGRRAFGDAWCERALKRMQRPGSPSELYVAYCDDLVRHGFPAGESGESSERLCYSLSGGHPEGRVRAAAMRALSKASGGALKSLREEDWQEWWAQRRAASASAAPAPKQPPEPAQP